MAEKKTIYIAGPITGVERYWEAFEAAEDIITELGHIALTPSRLPGGMTNAQYMRMCFAMIDSADAVLFLPGWNNSAGATLEKQYCSYINKPVVGWFYRDMAMITRENIGRGIKEALEV